MHPHAGQPSLLPFEPESSDGFADAMTDPNRGWCCTMRLETITPTIRTRNLFESDDELEELISGDLDSDPPDDVGQVRGVQRFFRAPLMNDVQRQLAGTPDAFVAQAVFDRKRRANVNVQSIQTLFVDVDCYNEGLSVSQASDKIRARFDSVGIQQPSIIGSGRGLYVKLPLTEAIPRVNLQQWTETQRGLGVLLSEVGSDKKVKDPARVLRVVGSVNSKVATPVQVIDRAAAAFGLSDVHEALRQHGILKPLAARAARQKRPADAVIESLAPTAAHLDHPRDSHVAPFSLEGRKFVPMTTSYAHFAWLAINDIERLISLRGGQIAPGLRDTYVFWNLNLLAVSGMVPFETFWMEAKALTARTAGLYDPVKDGTLSSLYDRVCQSVCGRRNIIYTPSRVRLMDEFEITPYEETHLEALISHAECERRRRVAQRSARALPGLQPRQTQLLGRVILHLDKVARRGAAEPPTAAELAARFSISENTARKYLRLVV